MKSDLGDIFRISGFGRPTASNAHSASVGDAIDGRGLFGMKSDVLQWRIFMKAEILPSDGIVSLAFLNWSKHSIQSLVKTRAHTFETRRRTTWKVIHERCVCILKVSGTLLEHSMEHSASFEYVHSDSTKGTNFWIYYLWILKRWGKYETMSMQSKQTAPVYTKWAQWNLPFSNDWTHNGQGN